TMGASVPHRPWPYARVQLLLLSAGVRNIQAELLQRTPRVDIRQKSDATARVQAIIARVELPTRGGDGSNCVERYGDAPSLRRPACSLPRRYQQAHQDGQRRHR